MTTGKLNIETGQRRHSVLAGVERVLDPTSEKKVLGKYGRRLPQFNKKINSNPTKNMQTDDTSSSCETGIAPDQSFYRLGQSSLISYDSQYRKKKLERSGNGNECCVSHCINVTNSNLPLPSVYSPTSMSVVKFTPIPTSTSPSDSIRTPKSSNNNTKCRSGIVNEGNISQKKNEGGDSSEHNQNSRSSFSQGIVQNAISECQQYGQAHVPLITPLPPQFWYNQVIPQSNINIVPPPPNYFTCTKPPLNIQKQDALLSGSGIPSNFHINIGSAGNIWNGLGGVQTIYNGQILSYPTYSLRSYEISTLNVINYLIPNREFRFKVSNAINDLRNWLEFSKIPLLVFPFGSTSTGFADQFSDVDIALIPKQDSSDRAKYCDSPISDIFTKPPGLVLRELLKLLQNDSSDALDVIGKDNSANKLDHVSSFKDSGSIIKEKSTAKLNTSDVMQTSNHPFACIQDITSAHIPIIRMVHTHTNIVLDISISLPSINISTENLVERRNQNSSSLHKILPIQKANSLPIIQSRLGILTWYAKMDPRVVHVVVLTKVWTRFRGLRNTLNGFPGGYAWTICVIFFFQKVGILPVIDANEIFIKSQNASKMLFKDVLDSLNSDPAKCRNKSGNGSSVFSSINSNCKEDKRETCLQSGIEKVEGVPEESYVDGNFPSLLSELDQEEINYKDDVEGVSNSNYDTETASGSAGMAEQASSSDSNFDSESDKVSTEKDATCFKMLYLDVVKGSKYPFRNPLDGIGNYHSAKPSTNSRYSVEDNIEESLLIVKNLNLDKPDNEALGESCRSSIGSTACTYSLSPGISSSDNMCINCMDHGSSCTYTQSNAVNVSNIGFSTEGTGCKNCFKQIESNKGFVKYSSDNIKDYHTKSNEEIIREKKSTNESNSEDSIRDIFDIDELFSSPPTLITNVRTIEESKFLKLSQSHILFYRFLKFIETHLWTTVIDISSPDIINTTVPGICCDIRNPFPGPPACRPIFDENNKRHLRNEIQRAIQIIQSPLGDFSSICGGYLHVSTEYSKGHSGEFTGTCGTLGTSISLPQSLSNINAVKQRVSPNQHIGVGFETEHLHIIGYNPGTGGNDQNNGSMLLPTQIPVTNLYGDSPQHLIFPPVSAPFHIPPPPPPPKNNKQLSSAIGGNEKKFT